jgi:hypothetical protein
MEFLGRDFRNEHIELDNNVYSRCAFTKCQLFFYGKGPINIQDCEFNESPLNFEGAAGLTLATLRSLYHGGFQRVIEQTFDSIRRQR